MSERQIATRHYNLSLLDLYQFVITASKEQVVENHLSRLLQHDGDRKGSSVVTLLYFQFQIFLAVPMLHGI